MITISNSCRSFVRKASKLSSTLRRDKGKEIKKVREVTVLTTPRLHLSMCPSSSNQTVILSLARVCYLDAVHFSKISSSAFYFLLIGRF